MTTRYGWEFADGTPDSTIERYCYVHGSHGDDAMPKWKHLCRAIAADFPEQFSPSVLGYVWSQWSAIRFRALCEERFQVWWGPGSSCKTTDTAVWMLEDFLAEPRGTTTILCSTTADMLTKKIWREVCRFWNLLVLGGRVELRHFRLFNSQNAHKLIYNNPGDPEGSNVIDGIFGVPAYAGSKAEQAIGHFSGLHNSKHHRMVIDEFQAMREPSPIEAWDNFKTGADAKFVGLCNPMKRDGPEGKESEPENGWDSIDMSMKRFRSKRGVVLFFNGWDSPGVRNPKRYPFAIQREAIEETERQYGAQSPKHLTQSIGWMPSEGIANTVMTVAMIQTHAMKAAPEWADEKDVRTVAAYDPAFSAGGDSPVLQPAKVGKFKSGLTGIACLPPIKIALVSGPGIDMTTRQADDVIQQLNALGIEPKDMAIEVTSAQRTLADVIERRWYERTGKWSYCYRIDARESPSDKRRTLTDKVTWAEVVDTCICECWCLFREFGVNGQVRGLSQAAADDFCNRLLVRNARISRRENLETKEVHRARRKKSPDDGDATAMLSKYCRDVLGIYPGKGGSLDAWEQQREKQRQQAVDASRFAPYSTPDMLNHPHEFGGRADEQQQHIFYANI
ncbi:MAG: hypothetical protein ABII76_09255 [Pseudomonadota bacterium]